MLKMADHEMQKPKIFISHATSDGEFANAVKKEIEKVFADVVSVFCTSSPGSIAPGKDWLNEIENKLKEAQAVIVIVTPTSIERPWLWFEVGATWLKERSGACRIYPLYAPEIESGDLPSPLNTLQSLSMGKAADLKVLFKALIEQFGFGKMSSFRASNITRRIPKYKDVKIEPVDMDERVFYSGKYTGYTNEELMEVIDTELLLPDAEKASEYGILYTGRESLIHNGKLLHFKQIDRNLELPPGTSKRLLVQVAERYKLEPEYQSENTVRFTKIRRS
jgi:hypothetical protein